MSPRRDHDRPLRRGREGDHDRGARGRGLPPARRARARAPRAGRDRRPAPRGGRCAGGAPVLARGDGGRHRESPDRDPPFTVRSSISGGSVRARLPIPTNAVALPTVRLPDVRFRGATFGGTDIHEEESTWWIDPLIGLRARADLSERVSFVLAATSAASTSAPPRSSAGRGSRSSRSVSATEPASPPATGGSGSSARRATWPSTS